MRRLVFMSAIAVGGTIRDAPLIPRLFARFVLRDIYADKIIGDDFIRRSDLDESRQPLNTDERFDAQQERDGRPHGSMIRA